ncbi:MAG TPA: hypothetical protein VEC57_10105 [Candidatus Limnocylindrales bacterium]|nr:hypothetical protein [Candidatus Limnocylindrales bacterium]
MRANHRIVRAGSVAFAALVALSPQVAGADHTRCGQPVTSGSDPTASDALAVLRRAVGTLACDLCVCDVNQSGSVTATDALATLKNAVGQDVDLSCVVCSVTETIGPSGGSITSHDGRLTIDFPQGALMTPTEITIAGLPPAAVKGDFEQAGVLGSYDVQPAGLVLDEPARATYLVPEHGYTLTDDGITFHAIAIFGVGLESGEGSGAGVDPEDEVAPIGDLALDFDALADLVTISGDIDSLGPLGILFNGGDGLTVELEDFPEDDDVGGETFESRIVVEEAMGASIAKPIELLLPDDPDVTSNLMLSGNVDSFMLENTAWIAPLTGNCLDEDDVGLRIGVTIAEEGVRIGAFVSDPVTVTVFVHTFIECFADQMVTVPINALGMEGIHRFHGPFGPSPDDDRKVVIATLNGFVVVDLATHEIDYQIDDMFPSPFNFGTVPLDDGQGHQTMASAAPQRATSTDYFAMSGFGLDSVFPGIYTDIVPGPDGVDGVSPFAHVVGNGQILRMQYDALFQTFAIAQIPVVSSEALPAEPFSLFTFPDGTIAIVTNGGGEAAGALLLHAGTDPDQAATSLGNLGIDPRRIRCAACTDSWYCAMSSFGSSELHVAEVDTTKLTGEIHGPVATGDGPVGTAIVSNAKGDRCAAVTANFSGNSYTWCEITLKGLTGCSTVALPQECESPGHVIQLEDTSMLFSCNQSKFIVKVNLPPSF